MNIYEMVTERIIKRLEESEEKGERFRWVKPFDITNGVRYACNYETQIPYTGINRLLAEPDEYLTFNQIKKMNDDLRTFSGVTLSHGCSEVDFNNAKPFHVALKKADAIMYSNKEQYYLNWYNSVKELNGEKFSSESDDI